MSKRLQVVLSDDELEEIREFARRKRLTVAEWVRQVLRSAREADPRRNKERKLDALRRAQTYSFPTGDVDRILDEIEAGYRDSDAT